MNLASYGLNRLCSGPYEISLPRQRDPRSPSGAAGGPAGGHSRSHRQPKENARNGRTVRQPRRCSQVK